MNEMSELEEANRRRDHFAAAALIGLIVRDKDGDDSLLLASKAFQIANSMIAWKNVAAPLEIDQATGETRIRHDHRS